MKKNNLLILAFSVLVGSLLTLNGCKDDTPGGTQADQNVYELLSASSNYAIITAAIDRAGLKDMLSSTEVTFFAPVDDAFLVSRTDPSTLSEADLAMFIKNHLVLGKFTTGDFPQPGYITSEATMGPNNEKLSLLTTRATGSTRVNDAQINSSTDATNGILHQMADVVEPATIYDHLLNNPDLETFKTAVALETVTKGEMSAAGEYTLFAPKESAMTKYLNDKNISISRLSPSDRRALVNNGLVDGKSLFKAEMNSGTEKTRGEDLTIAAGGDVTLNGDVKISSKDIQATNGVLHIIDGTLTK